ncbi:OmpA family protein [Niveibacterium sp. SC-1]|uniref:OmpA family protein n=1 Tax=Niveibacterium sp. SC-1 TaxID=3135646 RepID=UPI00311D75DF
MIRTLSKLRHAALALAVTAGAMFPQMATAETGEDHPEVARFPGAVIKDYDFREYEEAQLILSTPKDGKDGVVADKLLPVEGRVTYIHYETPRTTSALQVFRNYQSSLKRSGFKELFVCERPCGGRNLSAYRSLMKSRDLYLNGSKDAQYIAAQRGNTYVSMWVDEMGEPNVFLFVVEKQALDENRMGVTGASPMAKALNDAGKVDVYGFRFDTGKAVLRSESKATLGELATVLNDNPSLKIEIIGHTDNVGDETANQTLSEARAQAVAAALGEQHGIDAGRLAVSGQGASQPLADNKNEAGRAKNRRVEIVALSSPPPAANNTRTTTTQAKPAAQTPTPTPANQGENTRSPVDDANAIINAANKLKGLFGH